MIYDIYLSYSRKDIKTIEIVRKNLKQCGFRVYMDEHQIAGGDFAQELTKKIKEVKYVLFFYGNNTSNSTWVKREIEYALAQQKKIIPIILGEAIVDEWFRFHFEDCNWIYFNENSYSKSIDTIISVLQPPSFNRNIKEDENTIQYNHTAPRDARRKDEYSNQYGSPPTAKNSPSSSKFGCSGCGCLLVIVFIIWGVFRLCSPTSTLRSPSPEYDIYMDEIETPWDTLAADSAVVEFNEEEDTNYMVPTNVPDTSEEPQGATSQPENDDPYVSEIQQESYKDTNYYWLYLLLSFFTGCGMIVLLQKITKTKKANLKLSSNISAKVSIDGDLKKEITSREVYETHLDKGEYLVDFEDTKDNKRHQTFNHVVDSNECKLLFAQFDDSSMQNNKTIKCFIAGSKLLQHERDALRAVTCIMYNKWSAKNFRILSYTFEDFERAAVVGGHQKQYNNFIVDEADWALFIIDGTIGGITVEEYRMAMDSYKRSGRPKILALAKVGTEGNKDIAAIKEEINKEHQYWTDYTDINSLKYIFESTLNWDLIDLFQNQ